MILNLNQSYFTLFSKIRPNFDKYIPSLFQKNPLGVIHHLDRILLFFDYLPMDKQGQKAKQLPFVHLYNYIYLCK